MSLENVYVISQFVGAIAVVASLVFVGIQLRARRLEAMKSYALAIVALVAWPALAQQPCRQSVSHRSQITRICRTASISEKCPVSR